MSLLTTLLLSLGIPQWAVIAVASTAVLLAFGVVIGVAASIDEWLRTHRQVRIRKASALHRAVLRERKARQERMLQAMRESGELEGKALPVFLRRQAE